MKITNPLAVALLMTASAAMSQTPRSPNPGALKGGMSSGVCLPNDTHCQKDFMTGPGADSQTETIAAYNPPAETQWASPDCQHVPCALKDNDPIKPFKDSAELKKAIDEQKKLTPDAKIIDMGDGRYAMDLGNGKVTLGGTSDGVNGISSMPRPMSAVPGLKEKFAAQEAKDTAQAEQNKELADKSNAMWDGSSGGGTSANPGKGAKGTGERAVDLPSKSAALPSARDLGAEFAADQGDLMKGFGAEPVSDNAAGDMAEAGNEKIIKIKGSDAQAQAAQTNYTYTKINEAAQNSDRIIKGGAATFKTGGASDGVEGVKPTPTAAAAQ